MTHRLASVLPRLTKLCLCELIADSDTSQASVSL